MGDETCPAAMAARISSRRRWYTRGVVMMYSIVVRMTVAVVSEPAVIWINDSVMVSFSVMPWRMKPP